MSYEDLPQQEVPEDDRTHLLPDHKEVKVNPKVKHDSIESTDKRGLSMVTAMMVVYMCAMVLNSQLLDQYLFQYFATSLFGNRSIDTSKHPCANKSATGNSSDRDAVKQVQDLTSELNLNLSLVCNCVAVLANVILGISSDLLDRRILLLIPMLGYLAKNICFFVVVFFNLHPNWLYVGMAVEGISGGMIGLFMAIYLYTSDVTPGDRRRTLGVAIVQSVKGIVESGLSLAGGYLIEDEGFLLPSGISTGLIVIAVSMLCCLPNRKPLVLKLESEPWTFTGTVRRLASPFWSYPVPRVRKIAALSICTFFFIMFVKCGIYRVRTIYLMGNPFCFDAATLGWFGVARDLSYHSFTLFIVAVLAHRISGQWLGLLGVVSSIGGWLTYGFATNKLEIFLAPIVGIAGELPSTVLRGDTSQLLDSKSQGPYFAGLSMLESVSFTLGPLLSINLYRILLRIDQSWMFFIYSGLLSLILPAMCWLFVLTRRHSKEIKNNTFSIQK